MATLQDLIWQQQYGSDPYAKWLMENKGWTPTPDPMTGAPGPLPPLTQEYVDTLPPGDQERIRQTNAGDPDIGGDLIQAGMLAGIGGLGLGMWGPGAAGSSGGWASLGGGVDPGTTVFGGDGMTASLLGEYASPNTFLSSGADSAATLGTEADWWAGMPSGTVEATAGGGFGGTAGGASVLGTNAGKTALSALSQILKDGGSVDDWLKVAGAVGPPILSAIGSYQQSNALEGMADKFASYGAPARARYEGSFAPGFTMASDPGFTDALNQTSKARMNSLSVQGNPFNSPNALAQHDKDIFSSFAYPALQNYRTQNAAAGGLQNYAAAAPSAMASAVDSKINPWVSLASGAANIFNPPKTGAQTLAELLSTLNKGGF